jgi:hypothetical protein
MLLGLIVAATIYAFKGAITPNGTWQIILTGPVKAHLDLLLVAIAKPLSSSFLSASSEILATIPKTIRLTNQPQPPHPR